jgi:hypothetical protein
MVDLTFCLPVARLQVGGECQGHALWHQMVQMMRKQQARFAYNPRPSLKAEFELLAA